MTIKRALAVVAVTALTTLMAGSAFADRNEGSSQKMADNTMHCYDLMVQFDKSITGMKPTQEVRHAKFLRMKGARQCYADDNDTIRRGVRSLDRALRDIGQTPVALQ